MSDPTHAVQRLYEALPWPPSDAQSSRRSLLSTSWLAGAVFPRPPPVASGRRVLIAGCGRGQSALALATLVPRIEVVGVDVSRAAIAAAETATKDTVLAEGARVRFVRADLTDSAAMGALGRFDAVLCHAVADYIPDRRALLTALAGAASPEGLVYLSANTPDHPAAAVREAFRALGACPISLEQAVRPPEGADAGGLMPDQRRALRVAATALGAGGGVPELEGLPASVLAADVFAPFAHHLAPEQWVAEALDVGLRLVGSRVTAPAVADVPDSAVPALIGRSKGALGALFQQLRPAPSVEMLLCATPAVTPPFGDSEALARWVPTLDSSVPAHALPDWSPDQANEPRSLHVQIPGYPNVIVQTTCAALAVLRRADGTRDLNRCAAEVGVDEEDVRVPLWRAWVSDLLHLRAPL